VFYVVLYQENLSSVGKIIKTLGKSLYRWENS